LVTFDEERLGSFWIGVAVDGDAEQIGPGRPERDDLPGERAHLVVVVRVGRGVVLRGNVERTPPAPAGAVSVTEKVNVCVAAAPSSCETSLTLSV
jgi:hypothetical protein